MRSSFSAAAVADILAGALSVDELAAKYGVHRRTIYRCKKNPPTITAKPKGAPRTEVVRDADGEYRDLTAEEVDRRFARALATLRAERRFVVTDDLAHTQNPRTSGPEPLDVEEPR